MEAYETDEERVEALKKWWKENVVSLVSGLVIGLSALFGWNYWTDQQDAIGGQASVVYTGMMSAIAQGNQDGAQAKATEIIGKYSNSPYAIYAAMAMAKIKVEQGDNVAAASQLRWAMNHASLAGMQHISRLRLARVLAGQEKNDAALAELSRVDVESQGDFVPMYDELRGDILLQKGMRKEAYAAFQSAMNSLDQASQSRIMLQVKLDAIGNPDSTANVKDDSVLESNVQDNES